MVGKSRARSLSFRMLFPPRACLFFLILGWAAAFSHTFCAGSPPPYKDSHARLDDRVEDLFQRLTPDEKLSLLSGTAFTTQPLPRLGVPPMAMADAGQGVRGGMQSTLGPATAFPSGVTMAASWDVDLVRKIAQAIGDEARNKGTGAQVLLGPAVNIQRSLLGGRNGEYFSEDPYLAARMAVAYIEGMQSTGVSACIKHYACNNEEVDRRYVDVRVSERALREIYLPAFEAGVKEAKVWALMSAYNKINGPYATANKYLLIDVLKKGWGFDGLVMSDWEAVHEPAVAQMGNDLEMPGVRFASLANLKASLANHSLTQEAVDDSVRRILRLSIRTGLLDGLPAPDPAKVNSPEHDRLAREAALGGMVLLKNAHGLLPLETSKIHSLAVIGRSATHLVIGALGSPEVHPARTVQILDAVRATAGPGIKIEYLPGQPEPPLTEVSLPDGQGPGFAAQYYSGTNLGSRPILERTEKGNPIPNQWISRSRRASGKLQRPLEGQTHRACDRPRHDLLHR